MIFDTKLCTVCHRPDWDSFDQRDANEGSVSISNDLTTRPSNSTLLRECFTCTAGESGVSLGKGAWDCDRKCEIPPEKEVGTCL